MPSFAIDWEQAMLRLRKPSQAPGAGGNEPSHLLRFLALNAALGAACGIAIASVILICNVAGLKDLVARDGAPYIVMALLYIGFALTSAGVITSAAVMRLPWDEKTCDMRDPESGRIDDDGAPRS